MIDAVDNDAEYYYHRDGLGSVVALSDSAGDTVQTYEYSVYGQVAVSDPEFLTNPYMFTGRRFDIETGLYYYRARYYNPYIGRFLQTDPIGYGNGINWYAYCGNNPLNFVDPSGLVAISFYDPDDPLVMTDGSGVIYGGFQEYADDFEHNYEMKNFGDVVAGLLDMHRKGIEVTEVYFFDHCINNGEDVYDVTGLQFGDSHYEGDELKRYMELLGILRDEKYQLLAKDATLHFRHCFLGMEQNKDLLEDIAEWTKGDATGVNGWIVPVNFKQVGPGRYEILEFGGNKIPDYRPEHPTLNNYPLIGYSNYSIADYNPETGKATWGVYKPGINVKLVF